MKQKEKPRHSLLSNMVYTYRGLREFDPMLPFWILLNVTMTAAGNLALVVIPKLIIDQLTAENGSAERVIMLVILFGVAVIIANGISATTNRALGVRVICAGIRFLSRTSEKFMTTDFQNLEDPAVLDLSRKAGRASNSVFAGFMGTLLALPNVLSHLITLIGTLAIVSVVGPQLLIPILLLLIVNYISTKKARAKDKEINDSLSASGRKMDYINKTASDFSYGKEIRLFDMKEFLLRHLKNEQKTALDGQKSVLKAWFANGTLSSFTTMAQEALMYAWLSWRVIAGAINIGSFVMYLASIRTAASSLGGMLDEFANIQQQSKLICDFREFMDLPDYPTEGADIPKMVRSEGATIEFQNVSFRYPGSEQYALRDLNLKIDTRERLAVVGLNGAGKTTFVKLLMRLYRPESGKILINGEDISGYDRDEYFKLFSVVFQEINAFAFSIAENVSLDTIENTDIEKVRQSIETAGLSDKVASLERGLHTSVLKVIDDMGTELSGGETQKLMLARALYKNAPFIVLDEPTAALDALAEERLYLEFDKLTQDKTAVYISHRLASTRFCDRILLFDNGAVVENGSHDELMEKQGKYTELFNVQAQYYREKAAAEVV